MSGWNAPSVESSSFTDKSGDKKLTYESFPDSSLRNTRIVFDDPVKDFIALESVRSSTGLVETCPEEFIHDAFGIFPYAKRKPK